MMKLRYVFLASLVSAFPVVACGDDGGSGDDLDVGTDDDTNMGGSGNAPSTTGGSGNPSTGGNGNGGMGGDGSGGGGTPPPPGVPFSLDDCNATQGPSAAVKSSDVGAFTGDASWMDGWTNWSTSANKRGLVVPTDMGEVINVIVVSGELASNQLNWTKDKTYILDGYVRVPAGETLTIAPGTVVQGRINSTTQEAGTLFVPQGAKINAVGTAEEPIVFTSARANGSKAAGDWGGIVILGRAHVRQHPIYYEGLSGANFPWAKMGVDAEDESINDDDSGELKYVRIEFGGAILQANKEINGLSLGAVGSATKISYVQVNSNRDDCFEWFGGTVDADHLICNNGGDDMFDVDDSYQGTISYAFGRGTINSSSDPSGLEWDGVTDITNPTESVSTVVSLEHATICGADGLFGVPAFGAVLRRGIQGSLDDVFFVGWDVSIDTRDNFEAKTAGTPDMTITNSASSQTFFGVTDPAETDNDLGFDEGAWFAAGDGNKDWDAE